MDLPHSDAGFVKVSSDIRNWTVGDSENWTRWSQR
jgi:hypothetical protein